MTTINAEKRNAQWNTKALRRAGYIPASVYGGPLPDSISLQLPELTTRQLIRTCREGEKLTLIFDGQSIPVLLKEKTVSLLNDSIGQISFLAVAE